MWMLNSIVHSVILYFATLLIFSDGNEIPNAFSSGYLYMGNAVFTVSSRWIRKIYLNLKNV